MQTPRHLRKSFVNIRDVFLPSLDIILTMVPPGLSLSLSIGIEYAQSRLRRKQIVALKGRLINAAGRMKLIFFDKTGTLTINEMSLDSVYFALPAPNAPDQIEIVDSDEYEEEVKNKQRIASPEPIDHILKHFATNHSLSFIKNELLGDPMEIELFDFCNAKMDDEDDESSSLILDGLMLENGKAEVEEEKEEPYLKKISITEMKMKCLDHPQLKLATSNTSKVIPQNAVEMKAPVQEMLILRILDFKSQLQRMSVITQESKTGKTYVFTKGAPEKITQLCFPETMPPDLMTSIKTFAKYGYRILAFGSKEVDSHLVHTQPREFYESNLTFQGLALFKNNLKDQTKPTIKNLKRAQFKVGMITGDNINTAISIAKNCRLIQLNEEQVFVYYFRDGNLTMEALEENEEEDSFESEDGEQIQKAGGATFGAGATLADGINSTNVLTRVKSRDRIKIGAIDSENFRRIVTHFNLEEEGKEIPVNDPIIRHIAKRCRVFARMDPDQKALIVKIMKAYYKQKEYTVGFCGDGANDCIALKEADIGISLSKTEASLSAPFISGIEDISCVEYISSEGKAALTTNFDSFRYFCLTSIIQTIGLIVLFANQCEYSDWVYITCDIFVTLNLANCMGLLRPNPNLTRRLPEYTLFYKELMLSMGFNIVLATIAIFLGLLVIKTDRNYKPASELVDGSGPDDTTATYETTLMGLLMIQITFVIAMSFNIKGYFKQRFFTQPYMTISIILYQIWVIYLLFNADFSSMFPRTKGFNEWIMNHYLVDFTLTLVCQF